MPFHWVLKSKKKNDKAQPLTILKSIGSLSRFGFLWYKHHRRSALTPSLAWLGL